MKRVLKACVILSLIAVSGCVPFWRKWYAATPAPQVAGVSAHESWCYKTLGDIECYASPQRLPPESLVSVDPVSRTPLSREGYAKALAASQAPKK